MNLKNIKIQPPYRDKYDEDKNYHHILFRTDDAATLQAGELNELQSIFQHQLKHLGNRVLKNGTIVVPGAVKVVENADTYNLNVQLQSGKKLQKYDILKFGEFGSIQVVAINQLGLFSYDVITTELFKTEKFSIDDVFSIVRSDVTIGTGKVTKSGKTSFVTVSDGVIYYEGFFVKLNSSYTVPFWYNVNVTASSVSIIVDSKVVTEHEDNSLYSNAQGYLDTRAAGAHRLKLSATLQTIYSDVNLLHLNPVVDVKQIIPVANVTNDGIQVQDIFNIPTSLTDVLEKRTFEESGHYFVNHPGYEVQEHLKDESIGFYGRLTRENGGNSDLFSIGVKPFLGYIFGHRFETSNITWLDIKKPKSTFRYNNTSHVITYSNYIDVLSTKGIPSTGVYTSFDSSSAPVFEFIVYDFIKSNDRFRLFVSNAIKQFSTNSPTSISNNTNTFSGSINGLYPTTSTISNSIHPLPYNNIASVSDISLTYRTEFKKDADNSGIVTITTGSPNVTIDSNLYSQCFVSAKDANNVYQIVNNFKVATINTYTISVSLGALYANKNIILSVPCTNRNAVTKSISSKSTNETISFNSKTKKGIQLKYGNVVKVKKVKVISTDADITKDFILLPSLSTGEILPDVLVYNGSIEINTPLYIEYEYTEYGSGDISTASTYSTSIPPVINGINLRDSLDFRPIYTSNGVKLSNDTYPLHATPIYFDIEVYEKQAISIYASKTGTLGTALGYTSIDTPSFINVPSDAVEIFRVIVHGNNEALKNIEVNAIKYPRYTMKDIHGINNRVDNLEYYTALSLLENKAAMYDVLDPELGVARFKNGFAASNLKDMAILNPSKFSASIDTRNGGVHPMQIMQLVDRLPYTFKNLKIKNGVCTLPYADELYISQPLATGSISVNPYNIYTWRGTMKVTPPSDFWHDTLYQDANVITTNNVGVVNNAPTNNWWWWGNGTVETSTRATSSTSTSSRDSIVRTEVSKFMRPINLLLEVNGVKPLTRYKVLFNDMIVDDLVKSSTTLTSNRKGELLIDVSIPVSTTTRQFLTGRNRIAVFNAEDRIDNPSASVIFESGGTTDFRQISISVLNNISVNVTQTVSIQQNSDPIAQSFETGANPVLISKVGVFFKTKSDYVPVRLEIRPVENGIIMKSVLANAQKVLNPDNIVTSSSAKVETLFEFDIPVYLNAYSEYAVVILSESDEYKCFIATVGEATLDSTTIVDRQIFNGVMFKSQNGSTWTEDQLSDLKFNLYRAKFNPNTTGELIITPAVAKLKIDEISVTSNSRIATIASKGFIGVVGSTYKILSSSYNALTNKTFTIKSAVERGYSIELSDAMSDTQIATAVIEGNVVYNRLSMYLDALTLTDSYITPNIKTTTYTGNNVFTSQMPLEGIYSSMKLHSKDSKVSLEFKTDTEWFTPILNIDSSTVMLVSDAINNDVTNPYMVFETKEISFNRSFSLIRVIPTVKLPGSSNMLVYYSYNGLDWKTANTIRNTNLSTSYIEQELSIEESNISKIKFKFVFLSDDGSTDVEMKDLRMISFL